MTQPWKHPDSGIYYFRRVVPRGLRAIIGKREWKVSLGTTKPAECKRLHLIEASKYEAALIAARAGTPPGQTHLGAKEKRVALYLRVSTSEQTTENQRRELREVAERHGWNVVQVFEDAGLSGAKGRSERPGLDAMLKGVARKDFDVVAAWSVDRLGRSLQDLLGLLGELHAKGVGLYLHQQGLDTTTPAGKAMFQMMGVFAEFERAMIQERVKSGLARAKADGQKLGRPRIGAKMEAAIRAERRKGTGLNKIAAQLGIGVSAVQRVVAAL